MTEEMLTGVTTELGKKLKICLTKLSQNVLTGRNGLNPVKNQETEKA